MSKTDDLEILNCIYKNSKMAADCIDSVQDKCESRELCDYIAKQRTHYNNSCDKVARRIRELGGTPSEPPKTAQIMAEMGITMKTAADRSQNKIAKLMYDGTNMGIVDIAETVNHAAQATEKTLTEAKQLLSAEERYADGLKRFL
ncbi:MAG: hypothetical protein NC394_09830 [Bacteroides sp.]|nr:hypothetical protein [Bacteroides sp.]